MLQLRFIIPDIYDPHIHSETKDISRNDNHRFFQYNLLYDNGAIFKSSGIIQKEYISPQIPTNSLSLINHAQEEIDLFQLLVHPLKTMKKQERVVNNSSKIVSKVLDIMDHYCITQEVKRKNNSSSRSEKSLPTYTILAISRKDNTTANMDMFQFCTDISSIFGEYEIPLLYTIKPRLLI